MSTGGTAFERVLGELGRGIVGGQLEAGHTDTVEGLVRRTGASRSVVREVTRVLGTLGMLRASRRVGLTVRGAEHWDVLDPTVIRWRLEGPHPEDCVAELRALRRAVEPEAAAAAARRVVDARADERETVDQDLAELQAAARRLEAAAPDPDPAAFLAADRALHAAVLTLSANRMLARLQAVIAEALRDRALRERAGVPAQAHDVQLHRDLAHAITIADPQAAAAIMREIVDRTAHG